MCGGPTLPLLALTLASTRFQELRPLMAENAEELLQEAADAIPFAPGTRGSRRKKRNRERLRVVRVSKSSRKDRSTEIHSQMPSTLPAAG